MYEHGIGGLDADYEEAYKWYRRAADPPVSLARAQNSLGCLYYKGKGVRKNYQEAVYWIQKAAEQVFICKSIFGVGGVAD